MEIVLLHGALGSGRQLVPLMEVLIQQGCKVHALNFPAHGFTPKDSFSIAELSQFAENYIRENIKGPFSVFGFSMGGYVALHLATRMEPAAVVTLGTRFNWTPEVAERDARRMIPERIREKVPVYAEQLQELHGEDWDKLLFFTAAMMKSLGTYPVVTPAILQSINTPVLMMVGGADNMVTWEETREAAMHLTNGRAEVLPGVEHPIEKVDPELIAEKIMGFCGIPQNA